LFLSGFINILKQQNENSKNLLTRLFLRLGYGTQNKVYFQIGRERGRERDVMGGGRR